MVIVIVLLGLKGDVTSLTKASVEEGAKLKVEQPMQGREEEKQRLSAIFQTLGGAQISGKDRRKSLREAQKGMRSSNRRRGKRSIAGRISVVALQRNAMKDYG